MLFESANETRERRFKARSDSDGEMESVERLESRLSDEPKVRRCLLASSPPEGESPSILVSEGLSNNEQSVEAATEEMPTELRTADVRVELRPADEGVAEAVVRDLENEEVALRLTLRLRSVDAGVASLMLSS